MLNEAAVQTNKYLSDGDSVDRVQTVCFPAALLIAKKPNVSLAQFQVYDHAADRAIIEKGCEMLGVDLGALIQDTIMGMREVADAIGLRGTVANEP